MKSDLSYIPRLCRAETGLIQQWLTGSPARMLSQTLPLLIISCAIYGATLGLWHGPEMAFYIGVKFPLAILITLTLTTLLNGITAILTGSGISLAQSLQFLLIGFSLFGTILASLAPVLFFMNLNAASPGEEGVQQSYRIFLLSNVLLIAFAGCLSFHILLRHVRHFSLTTKAGNLTFLNWLAINFFAGAQVTYLMRPFFGSPDLEPQFLRDNMLEGNFYEAIYNILTNLI